jgi:hypothetical protein
VLEIGFRDPFVIGRWVALPRHEVLEFASDPFVGADGFDFEFFFVIYDVRRRFSEIRTMNLVLSIRREFSGVEVGMNLPLWREFESVREGGDDFFYDKGSIAFWGELLRRDGDHKVLC